MHDWGVFELMLDDAPYVEFHVAPNVDVGGITEMSGMHELSVNCPCGPRYLGLNVWGCDMWTHHDPDHPGAMAEEDFAKLPRRKPEKVVIQ